MRDLPQQLLGVDGASSTKRQTRARSVDVLASTRELTTKNDAIDKVSKMKDFDLKKSIDARLDRLTNSLTGPAKAATSEESSKRKLRRSRLYLNESEPAEATGVVVGRGRGSSVPPVPSSTVLEIKARHAAAQPPYAIEKLAYSSAAVERRGNVLLRGLDSGYHGASSYKVDVGRPELYVPRSKSYISELLESLRGGHSSRVYHDELPLSYGTRDYARQEVDSFANTINKLRLPSTVGEYRHSGGRGDSDDDFRTRLQRSLGDLGHLESLVGQTFHWGVGGVRVHPRAGNNEIQIHRRPGDIVYFNAHADEPQQLKGYNKTSASAELAIKWAEERRRQVELELERERGREGRYRSPRPLGQDEWTVEYSRHAQPTEQSNYSRYLQQLSAAEEHQQQIYDIPTIVRPPAGYKYRQTAAPAAVTDDEDFDTPVSYKKPSTGRPYTRSASDSVVTSSTSAANRSTSYAAPSRSSAAVGQVHHSPAGRKPASVAKAQTVSTTEVRRHVREVLDKYKKA